MRVKNKILITSLVAAPLALLGTAALAEIELTPVPDANPKVTGVVAPTVLSPEFIQTVRAAGATPLENPSALTGHYGYDSDGPMLPAPGDIQATGHNVEATKTEPDKNTYLVLEDQHGADPHYDYGTHFLFQGHEGGIPDPSSGRRGYVTRVNLDADGAHRVTLLADQDANGQPLPTIDGSTWYPWSKRLLFTAENGKNGGVWQATPDYPSKIEDISGVLGRGGYEGIQADSDGNLWIVEDVGGKSGDTNKNAKQPNSFVYRFIPKNRANLSQGGTLQALQVLSKQHSGPIVFNTTPDTDILSADVKDLHTYGLVFDTQWVTIHDTDTDGAIPFDANALAKLKSATAFKRPENGQFRPGSRFREFYFDETGDTNAETEAGADYGGFGAIQKLTQNGPSASRGKLTLFYKSDSVHSAFDNVGFLERNLIVFVEDAGDKLHSQRKALDSAYLFDVRLDYSDPKQQPIRILAQGRDPSATLDSGLSVAGNGFQNDGDNEITGFHVSDGDPTIDGILGFKIPTPFKLGWRVFYTQQHGDNVTYEILRDKRS
jgi:hypothetical protein